MAPHSGPQWSIIGLLMLRTTRSGRGVGPGIRSWVENVIGRAPLTGFAGAADSRLPDFGCVREQRDGARPLERGGQRPLVAGTGPGDAAGQDLAPVADEAAQPRDLLVVDVGDLLDAERADLAVLAPWAPRPRGPVLARRSGWTVHAHLSICLLEGDLVRVDVARDIVRGGNVVGRGRPVVAARRHAVAGGGGAAAVEELNIVGDDLRRPALLAVLAFPRAGLDAALDEDERALARVLGDDLGKIPLARVVGDDVVVVGELLALALGPARPAVGGDAEVGHSGPARRVAHLRVLGQTADEKRFV